MLFSRIFLVSFFFLVDNLLTYVQWSSKRNGDIALEMKRITQVYEDIVETIDPQALNGFRHISDQLKVYNAAQRKIAALFYH